MKWWARLGLATLTALVIGWAISYYRAWAGTAIPAFGPVAPYVTAWRHALLWHFATGVALVPAWMFASYKLWQRRAGRPRREEFPRLRRTSS